MYFYALEITDAVSVDANFNMNGVKGFVRFSQRSPANSTVIEVSLSGLDQYPLETFPWHIHNYPFTTQQHRPCSAASVGGHFDPFMANSGTLDYSTMCLSNRSLCEVGDLSGKFGKFNASSSVAGNFTDDSLLLYGVHSIVGRSVVIHRSNGDRWVCANIEYPGDVTVAYSPFRANLIGNIFFIEPYSPMNLTTVFVRLSYISGSGSSSMHDWYLHNNPIGSDSNCGNVGNHYNPRHISTESTNYSFCSPSNQVACQVGDLTKKSSSLDFSNAAHSVLFYTDINLPIRVIKFNETILGRSVVIHPEKSNPAQIACANLSEYSHRIASAKFQEDGVTGQVVFKQSSPFSPTVVRITLSGLSSRADGYHVHEFPVDETIQGNSKCTAAGGHFNPRNITRNSSSPTTFDAYEMGDLSGKSSKTLTGFNNLDFTYTDPYLPLFGIESIVGRSVVIHYPNGDRWLCANILYDMETVSITAEITNGTLQGRLVLTQLANDPFSETIIYLDFNVGPPVVSSSTVQATPTLSTSMTSKASTNGSTAMKTVSAHSASMETATSVTSTSSVLTTAMTTTPQSSIATNTSSISTITSSNSTIIVPTKTSNISNTANTIFSSSTKTAKINSTSTTSKITASPTKTAKINSTSTTSSITASPTKTAKINSTSTTSSITASPTKTAKINSISATSNISASPTKTAKTNSTSFTSTITASPTAKINSTLFTSTIAASSVTTTDISSSSYSGTIAASSTTTTGISSSSYSGTIAASSIMTTGISSSSYSGTIAASSTTTTGISSSSYSGTIAASSTMTTGISSSSYSGTSSTMITDISSSSYSGTIAALSTRTTGISSSSYSVTSSTTTTGISSSSYSGTIAASSTMTTGISSSSYSGTSSTMITDISSSSYSGTLSTMTTGISSSSYSGTIVALSTRTTGISSSSYPGASSTTTTDISSSSFSGTIAASSTATTDISSSSYSGTIAASSTTTTGISSSSYSGTIATTTGISSSSYSGTIATSSTTTTGISSSSYSGTSSTTTTGISSNSYSGTIAASSTTTAGISSSSYPGTSFTTTTDISSSSYSGTIAASSTTTTDISSSLYSGTSSTMTTSISSSSYSDTSFASSLTSAIAISSTKVLSATIQSTKTSNKITVGDISTSNTPSSSPSKTLFDKRRKNVFKREANIPVIYLSVQNSCELNASVSNPYSASTSSCSPDNQLACPVGNLTGKHGRLSLGRNLLTDLNLPLTGPDSSK